MKLFDDLFLNIGAMKSGTSWLAKQLEDHPDIFLTPIKEIHYFAHIHSSVKFLDRNGRIEALKTYITWLNPDLHPDIVKCNLRWFGAYLDEPINDAWFYNLYRGRQQKQYCGEFSNLTALLDDKAWHHIKSISNNLKVSYTMRDPYLRLWSHTRFQAQINGIFNEIPHWGQNEYANFIKSGDILQHARYSHTISTLRRNLNPSQFILLYFEDFRNDPVGELRRLENFLGVSNSTRMNPEFHNPSLPLEVPESFLLAARDPLMAELDTLNALNITIPAFWTTSLSRS